MQVVGYEGVLGVIALAVLLTIVQFLPGKDGEGIHEDTRESIHMVSIQLHGSEQECGTSKLDGGRGHMSCITHKVSLCCTDHPFTTLVVHPGCTAGQ